MLRAPIRETAAERRPVAGPLMTAVIAQQLNHLRITPGHCPVKRRPAIVVAQRWIRTASEEDLHDLLVAPHSRDVQGSSALVVATVHVNLAQPQSHGNEQRVSLPDRREKAGVCRCFVEVWFGSHSWRSLCRSGLGLHRNALSTAGPAPRASMCSYRRPAATSEARAGRERQNLGRSRRGPIPGEGQSRRAGLARRFSHPA